MRLSVSHFFLFCFLLVLVLFFFFSSRRRHTRFKCDWSSDVCSSDLDTAICRRCSLAGCFWNGRQNHGRRVMRANEGTRTAAQILVDQLVIHGAKHVFCVPGESYIAALDAFYDRDIAVTVCRHESGAAIMAEACGKGTRRPGICFVTRGPGATNAAAGLHIARQDSPPLSLFVGQIRPEMREREAFQDIDSRARFGSIAKWATEIDD